MPLKTGLLMVIVFLVLCIFNNTGLETEGFVTPSRFSYDLDGDRIDDSITGPGPFPVIIHLSYMKELNSVVDAVEKNGGAIQSRFTIIDAFTAIIPKMEEVKRISAMDGVSVIEAQRELEFLMDSSVPSTKASRSSTYSPQTARDLGYTGKGVTIAVIDSGVDNEHPMLEGAFVAGVDFTLPESPLTPRDGSFDPDDRNGHGTGVASIALGRDLDGVVGVAPDAGLIDLKIGTSAPRASNPQTSGFLDSLQWCVDNQWTDWGGGYIGVDIISLSLSIGPPDGANAIAVNNVVQEGIVVIQGAGNSAGPYEDQTDTSWPDRSIIVGGLDHMGTVDRSDDIFWSGSTSGPRTDDDDEDRLDELKPDLTAPSVDLSFASHSTTSNLQSASGLSSGSGTSYASPHVSGVVALMMEANPSIRPDTVRNPVKMILHRSSEPRGDPTFPELSSSYNANYGWGILDAYQSVISARSYTDTNHRPAITSFTVNPKVITIGSTATITVTATDIDEDQLTYSLEIDDGSITGTGPTWQWTAPDEAGSYSFLVTVMDPSGASDQKRTDIEVTEGIPNRPPVITSFNADDRSLNVGGSTRVAVVAFDQDDDPLNFEYFTITGTITGQGEEVTYNAPFNPGTDTLTVIVSDPSGASDQRDLTITIMEDTTNSPPSILLLDLEPGEVTSNNTGSDVILTATIDDPDGYNDIDLVIADLSGLGGSDGERMFDDGSYPDNTSNDGVFSLLVPLPQIPLNGIYSIEVSVYDSGGESTMDTIDIVIDIRSAGDVSSSTSSGPDLLMIFSSLGAVLIILTIVVVFVIARSRKRKGQISQYAQHPYYPQVRYRPSSPPSIQNPSQTAPIQVGPSSQVPPKFNVVSGR